MRKSIFILLSLLLMSTSIFGCSKNNEETEIEGFVVKKVTSIDQAEEAGE